MMYEVIVTETAALHPAVPPANTTPGMTPAPQPQGIPAAPAAPAAPTVQPISPTQMPAAPVPGPKSVWKDAKQAA
ncbi:MAG: hypothetical protein OWS74_08855 [Firmicutes bacterium]|nr:hypothetical protein [Bacillota bacterium]